MTPSSVKGELVENTGFAVGESRGKGRQGKTSRWAYGGGEEEEGRHQPLRSRSKSSGAPACPTQGYLIS